MCLFNPQWPFRDLVTVLVPFLPSAKASLMYMYTDLAYANNYAEMQYMFEISHTHTA